jgi:hypothetical protein
MATVAFDSRRTIFHGLAGTEMAPLRVMPASDNGYELMTISKILDGHTWEMRPNEKKISRGGRERAAQTPGGTKP